MFILITINLFQSHEYRQTCSFAYFLDYLLLFLDDNMDEEYK